MLYSRRTRIAFATLLTLAVSSDLASAQPNQASPNPEDAFEVMSERMVEQSLKAAAQVAAWQKQIQQAVQTVKEVQSIIADVPGAQSGDNEIMTWIERGEKLLDGSPKLRELTKELSSKIDELKKSKAEAKELFEAYEQQLKLAARRFVVEKIEQVEGQLGKEYPQVYAFVARAQEVRQQLKLAQQQVEDALKLGEFYKAKVLDAVAKLRDPAQTARKVLDTQVAELINQPRTIGDVTFKLQTRPDAAQSIFSKKADIGIQIVYVDQLKVDAKGLYFKSDGTPVFDNVKITSNLKSLLGGAALKQLGDAIPNLGGNSPIGLEFVEFLGFEKNNGHRGGIKFNLSLNFIEFLPGLEAEGVVMYADGHVDLGPDATLQYKDKTGTPYQIPGTGLAFFGYTIGFNPKTRSGFVKTDISTFPGDPKAMRLTGKCSFSKFPPESVAFDGELVVAQTVTVGTVEARLSREGIKGKLMIPGKDGSIPLEQLGKANVEFELNKDGFFGHGDILLFGGSWREKMDMVISFHGGGSFTPRQDLNLLGIEISRKMAITYEPGFQDVHLLAEFSLLGVDLGSLGTFNVAVKAEAFSNKEPPVRVHAEAGVLQATLELASFKDLTREKLLKALKDQAPPAIRETLKLLKDVDVFNKNSALREGMVELDIFNKDSAVRQGLGDVADFAAKNDPGRALGNALGIETGSPADVITGMFGGGFGLAGGSAVASAASHAADRQRKRNKDVKKKLGDFIKAVNKHPGLRKQPSDRFWSNGKGQRRSEIAELHINFKNCVGAPYDNNSDDAIVLLTVATAGYHNIIDTRPGKTKIEPSLEGDHQVVKIRFKNLLNDSRQTSAAIAVPKLKSGTRLPAQQIARDELQRLIELYLPGVEIEGNSLRQERKLVVKNETDERIKVFVQVESRYVKNHAFHFSWKPSGKLGSDAAAYQFELAPGEYFPNPKSITKSIQEKVKEQVNDAIDRLPFGAGGGNGKDALPTALQGRSARVWAVSETGIVWSEFRHGNLLLVRREEGGRRQYHSEKVETVVHRIKAPSGPRVFHERVLKIRNDTSDTLVVTGDVLTHARAAFATSGGFDAKAKPRFHAFPSTKIAPGKTVTLRYDNDWVVRGSKVRLKAHNESDTLRWLQHAEDPIPMVEADGYREEEMGTFLFVFRPLKTASTP